MNAKYFLVSVLCTATLIAAESVSTSSVTVNGETTKKVIVTNQDHKVITTFLPNGEKKEEIVTNEIQPGTIDLISTIVAREIQQVQINPEQPAVEDAVKVQTTRPVQAIRPLPALIPQQEVNQPITQERVIHELIHPPLPVDKPAAPGNQIIQLQPPPQQQGKIAPAIAWNTNIQEITGINNKIESLSLAYAEREKEVRNQKQIAEAYQNALALSYTWKDVLFEDFEYKVLYEERKALTQSIILGPNIVDGRAGNRVEFNHINRNINVHARMTELAQLMHERAEKIEEAKELEEKRRAAWEHYAKLLADTIEQDEVLIKIRAEINELQEISMLLTISNMARPRQKVNAFQGEIVGIEVVDGRFNPPPPVDPFNNEVFIGNDIAEDAPAMIDVF